MRAQHIWKEYSSYQEALAKEERKYSGELGKSDFLFTYSRKEKITSEIRTPTFFFQTIIPLQGNHR
ncbi:MAG: hypothetical protein MUO42_09200 [Anaerolineaceae bacterium]|nr:hypothetical protein [Anaerolineaceae bacterium]